MKTKLFLMVLALFVMTAAVSFAADAQMGVWKLNEGKSKMNAAMGKNNTVTMTAEGDNVKVVIDGVNGDGSPRHNEWVGKFDGKDYPVTGDPNSDARSYARVDDLTLAVSVKKGGKETMKGTSAISPDGKTRTVSISGTDSKGEAFDLTAVYDKQ